MIEQGHIVFIPFPYSDLRDRKVRPVLILSNESLHKTRDFIGVGISTKKSSSGALRIPLANNDLMNGSIESSSLIYPHKIGFFEKQLIRKVIAKVQPEVIKKVIKELNSYFAA